jgi:gamma-glutamylputrescine oxidase
MGAPSLWQSTAPWPGCPPLSGEARADVVVVGAGITGAACAWRLLEHGLDVVVLDAREPAAAASGRNGGFAVTGTAMPHGELARRLGAVAARQLHDATAASLAELVALAEELGVPGAVREADHLWLAEEDEAAELDAVLAAAGEAGIACEPAGDRVPAELRARFPVAAVMPGQGELDPARFVRAYAAGAAGRGARLHDRTPVRAVAHRGAAWVAETAAGAVTAQAAVIACDGLVASLVPELEPWVYPVRGQMLATAPLPRHLLRLDLPAHCRHGFMYFRPTADGRMAIGGGRLEHLEDEYTDEERTTAPVQATLEVFAREVLRLHGVEITHRWAGIMGFSADLLPLAGQVAGRPGLYIAGGYSGTGNVLGHHCGRLVADLIATGAAHPHASTLDPGRFADAPPGRLEQVQSRALAAASRRPGEPSRQS